MAEVFDKAKYHEESCLKMGLSEDQSFVHTGIFLAWLVIHDLVVDDEGFSAREIADCKARRGTPTGFYEWQDGVFIDTQLTEKGSAFAHSYFDFETGQYINDYMAYVAKGLRSEFHVPNTWQSYDGMAPVIEARYRQFSGENVPMPPKPTQPLPPAKRRGFRWPWSKD